MERPSTENSDYKSSFSQDKVATSLSLVWRSNQFGISRSNTVSQLAEAVIIDRNSKECPQNEVNQKKLPQLKKHFTKSKDCQGRSRLIYCQARTSSNLIMFYIVCNINPI